MKATIYHDKKKIVKKTSIIILLLFFFFTAHRGVMFVLLYLFSINSVICRPTDHTVHGERGPGPRFEPRTVSYTYVTCVDIKAGVVEGAHEELQPNDGVDDDDEEDEQGDVHQGYDGHQDGVHHNLQTCTRQNRVRIRSFGIPCKSWRVHW